MPKDIRMKGFRERATVDSVYQVLNEHIHCLDVETISIQEAADRVLAESIISTVSVPGFRRAAMDGYALKAEETFGSSGYNPLEFQVIGEILPGQSPEIQVQSGQAARIMTGAPLPEGANAVLMAEHAEESKQGVRITDAVTPGRHVGRIGEDIAEGSEVLAKGRQLRPQDLGVLASIGCGEVKVIRQPRVTILITGDELLPCGATPEGYQIVDSNSVMLKALVRRVGGLPEMPEIVPDGFDSVKAALQRALNDGTDIVLLSGGSSVGKEDHAPNIINELGELAIHGVALRPAGPAGVGFVDGRPVFLMPGNPVSCLCAFDLFVGPTLRKCGGRISEISDLPQHRTERLPLKQKIASVVGRVDYVRVRIDEGQVEPLATSGASILSSTTRADGFVLIPGDCEGYPPGESVTVFRYD